jgi:hypothetical protein
MKRICIALILVTASNVSAKLVDELIKAQGTLTQSRKQLVEGKNKVLQGKADVAGGYWKIKHDVVETLGNASNDLQPTICMISSVEDKTHYIDRTLGELNPAVADPAKLVIGAATVVVKPLFGGIPEMIGSLKGVLVSVDGTLKTVRTTVNNGNEPLNPGSILSFALHAEQNVSQINTLLSGNTDKIKADYATKITAITSRLTDMINLVKNSSDSLTETFKEPATATGLQDAVKNLAADFANAGLTNAGTQVAVGKDTLDCPKMGDDPAVTAAIASAITFDKGADTGDTHPWLDTRDNVMKPIIKALAEVNPAAWSAVGAKNIPVMYQQFTLSAQKFDAAIAKIDETVGAFQKIIDRLQKKK